MQQHPVPQNVINFQFKLVGDMTLKQFGYLAGGIILGIVASKMPYPAIFNYTLAGILAFTGFALAFLPIEERPLDVWLKNFFISIFSPTQFLYRRTGGVLDFLNLDLSRGTQNSALIIEKSLKQDKYHDYLKTLGSSQKNLIDLAENHYLKSLDFNILSEMPVVITPLQPQQVKPVTHDYQNEAVISLAEISRPDKPFEEIKVRPLNLKIQGEIKLNEAPRSQDPNNPKIITSKMYEKTNTEFQSINVAGAPDKTRVTKEIYQAPKPTIAPKKVDFEYLKRVPKNENAVISKTQTDEEHKKLVEKKFNEIEEKNQTINQIPAYDSSSKNQTIDVSSLKRITQTPQTPQTPNIVSGTIISKTEEPIPGAILEIKNQKNLSVRTLKTNRIGQFASAMPLENGEYTLIIEKEDFSFDNIKIILDNKIVEPILIKAK